MASDNARPALEVMRRRPRNYCRGVEAWVACCVYIDKSAGNIYHHLHHFLDSVSRDTSIGTFKIVQSSPGPIITLKTKFRLNRKWSPVKFLNR